MKQKKAHGARYISLAVVFVFICIIYIVRLVNYQITGVDLYVSTKTNTYTRTEIIQSHRGEVFDRNGKALISNKYTYNLDFDYGSMPRTNAEKNEMFLAVRELVSSTEGLEFPEIPSPILGTYPDFSFDGEFFASSAQKRRFERVLKDHELDLDIDCEEFTKYFLKRYGLVSGGEPKYSPEEVTFLLKLRFELYFRDFAPTNPWRIADGVDISLISYVKEAGIRGLSFSQSVERVYNYPGYASHLLGRCGKIPAEDTEYYTSRGYSLDAIVGTSGVEKAFEEYLRGVDGVRTIVEDAYGNVIEEYVSVEPIAGKDVYLTLDIDLQIAAEDALKNNIEYIAKNALTIKGEQDGEDADAGGLTVIDPNTGELLASASYPTYDLSTFSEDWDKIRDDPLAPMNNRAFSGMYPPGSTFKIATAIAALEEKVITPSSTIATKGRYTYYDKNGPRCWIYLMRGQTHGIIDVTEAIQESCNYFFFEVGRLVGIEKLNYYCSSLGLGEPTGIELPEWRGILAGPEYRENNGLDIWNPGDTLNAAIGQAENAFSPLQLSTYMSTVVNGGTRYKTHLLYAVKKYGTNEVILQNEPEVVSELDISALTHKTVLNAMKDVTENGSASRLFRNYPISVGGKTGTAQVSKNASDNAIFTAFAPFDDPKLVVSCVIERGSSGTDAGFSVRDIFDVYFGLKEDGNE